MSKGEMVDKIAACCREILKGATAEDANNISFATYDEKKAQRIRTAIIKHGLKAELIMKIMCISDAYRESLSDLL